LVNESPDYRFYQGLRDALNYVTPSPVYPLPVENIKIRH